MGLKTGVPHDAPLDQVISKNIQALLDMRRDLKEKRRPEEKMADAISTTTGTLRFLWLQAIIMFVWIFANVRIFKFLPVFDPYPFPLLSTVTSVEAIFLAGFILISQSRNQTLSERRDDLDLHINLLSEHEITQLLNLVDAIGKHLKIERSSKPDVEELKRNIEPEMILDKIEQEELAHAHEMIERE